MPLIKNQTGKHIVALFIIFEAENIEKDAERAVFDSDTQTCYRLCQLR